MIKHEKKLSVELKMKVMYQTVSSVGHNQHIAHFIKPYRDQVHFVTGSRQGFMKRAVLNHIFV